MITPELMDKFASDTRKRLGFDNFDIYLTADAPHSIQLEGEFTSDQLRLIAEELDRFNAETAKSTTNT